MLADGLRGAGEACNDFCMRTPLTAFFLILAGTPVFADNLGNVTVTGGGACRGIVGILPVKVDAIPAPAPDTTVFRLALLAAIPGTAQPQYVIAKVTQAGKATSGTAQIFNNGLLGASGPFLNGTWTGKFPATNAVASVDLGPLTITAGPCTLTLTNGQTIF